MKRLIGIAGHWLAEQWARSPWPIREYSVRPDDLMCDARRHLLRQLRRRINQERPNWTLRITS